MFLSYLFALIFVVNIFMLFIMIFIERKKPNVIISWLVVFTFLPIIGFLIYILIGNGLNYKTSKMLKKLQLQQKEYMESIKSQKKFFLKRIKNDKFSELILYNLNNANSAYFERNSVKIFTNGEQKIKSLKKDLEKAKHSINLLYYIFANDAVGSDIMKILIRKAKEGVKVKLIYDSVGCFKTKRSFFKKLEKAGGEVAEFFPPVWGLKFLNLKANYRNHRKIVVIDGKIGYTGGINIRDDHMGKKIKLSPWRDTHLRIYGGAVYSLQIAFLNDWKYCKNTSVNINSLVSEGYFPKTYSKGSIGTQIITSGPEGKNQPIKEAIIKMILSAKKNLSIQTPYFIPDEFMIGALDMAKKSGVQIDIIIPSKADKNFVYNATLSYVKDFISSGINFYLYNGFMHSKMIIVDESIVTIGTCNLDNRSFALNFEINSFFYNAVFAEQCYEVFQEDLKNSQKIDKLYFKRKPWINNVAQAFFRLFSPLL